MADEVWIRTGRGGRLLAAAAAMAGVRPAGETGGADEPDADDAVLTDGALPGAAAGGQGGAGAAWRLLGPARLVPADGASARRLADAGVAVAGGGAGAGEWSGASARRHFRVPSLHLEALAVRRAEAVGGLAGGGLAGGVPSDWGPSHPLYRRLARTAVRALYALELDYGEVLLAADDEGRVRVTGVGPPAAEPDLPLWADALSRFRADFRAGRAAERTGRAPTIGADPEFVMLRPDGRIASADRFFPRAGAAGADSLRAGGRLLYPLAELRPDPAGDPAALARNVRRLLLRAAGRTQGQRLRWLAGGMPVPGVALGGHIHLGGVWLNSRLLRVLDSCLALPLAAAEDPAGRKRRQRYGRLGDYRRKPYGGFEYRTPPSWLVSPLAAQASFALALLAARDYWRIGQAALPAETEAGRAAYYAGDAAVLRACAAEAHRLVAAAPSYGELGRWIAPLFAAIAGGASWDESGDIRAKWRIPVT